MSQDSFGLVDGYKVMIISTIVDGYHRVERHLKAIKS